MDEKQTTIEFDTPVGLPAVLAESDRLQAMDAPQDNPPPSNRGPVLVRNEDGPHLVFDPKNAQHRRALSTIVKSEHNAQIRALRKVNSELVAENCTFRARIDDLGEPMAKVATLEAELADARAAVTQANETIKTITAERDMARNHVDTFAAELERTAEIIDKIRYAYGKLHSTLTDLDYTAAGQLVTLRDAAEEGYGATPTVDAEFIENNHRPF